MKMKHKAQRVRGLGKVQVEFTIYIVILYHRKIETKEKRRKIKDEIESYEITSFQ